MSDSYVRKNGLIYTEDLKTVVGIDSESNEFTGRVPYGANAISEDAFAGSSIKEITLPDSVKELSAGLFENLSELEKVKIPDSIQELPPYLFSGCTSLKTVKLPAGLTAFSEGLFNGCESLQEIPFRENMQELPENVFAGCTSLKSVVIPNTVSKICSNAFAGCTNLEAIVIPAKLYDLADDAFTGCDSIRTVRVDPDNHLFYVGEDGNLYEKNIELELDDLLRLRIVQRGESENSFLEENADEPADNSDMPFVSSDELEEDETFSSEIEASEEEKTVIGVSKETITDNITNTESEMNNVSEENMADENTSEVDSIFADIMNDEKNRNDVSEDVAISDEEGAILSQTMETMADAAPANNVAVSTEELEKLFASHEAKETAANEAGEESGTDSKTQILVNSVEFSRVIETGIPAANVRSESDLFVIAENLVTNESGDKDFSPKLLKCVEKVARIQDFKKVILLKGLPLDNDEFMQFYYHFISKKNIILACAASSAAELTDYCKKVCEQSRINLSKDELAEQRRCISIKNDLLIKLVIQDIYE